MSKFLFLCVAFLQLWSLVFSPDDQQEIKAKPGDDVTLQCQSPRDANITVLEWSRPDLKTEEYVLFFRDDHLYEQYQHPSFHGRVQLRDREMKDGNVSVILKNVTINDTGTYECRVSVNSTELINTTINLKVEDSGHTAGNTRTEGDKDGYTGVVVGLSVGGGLLLVIVIVVFCIFRECKSKRQKSDQDPDETSVVSLL
ncbi:coxsackievirus and adenovirus receptor-like [Thunnus thynnus]|uniref:coxsackievirus and adenovirus receptor-like n=1 Tax=Thunnus thynnus TaxID=8237 RepID=UPI0035294771